MAAHDDDGARQSPHHDDRAVPHVPRIGLVQEWSYVPSSGKAGAVVKDTPVAAVGGIPDRIAFSLRLGVGGVVNGQITVAIGRHAEGKAMILLQDRLLNVWKMSSKMDKRSGEELLGIGSWHRSIIGIEQDLLSQSPLLKSGRQCLRDCIGQRAGQRRHQRGVLLLKRLQPVMQPPGNISRYALKVDPPLTVLCIDDIAADLANPGKGDGHRPLPRRLKCLGNAEPCASLRHVNGPHALKPAGRYGGIDLKRIAVESARLASEFSRRMTISRVESLSTAFPDRSAATVTFEALATSEAMVWVEASTSAA